MYLIILYLFVIIIIIYLMISILYKIDYSYELEKGCTNNKKSIKL